jgi:hypothetical protein
VKSFAWMYSYIKDFEFTGGDRFGEFKFKFKAPKECPDKISEWLGKRFANKTIKKITKNMTRGW